MSNIGDMFISLGIKPQGDLHKAEKAILKLDVAAGSFEHRINRLGRGPAFAGVIESANSLNRSLVTGLRAAHANVNAINALADAHRDLRSAAQAARSAVTSVHNASKMPTGGSLNIAGAVGVSGGIRGLAGSAGIDAQRARTAANIMSGAMYNTRVLDRRTPNPLPPYVRTGHPAIDALAEKGTFDIGVLRRGSSNTNESHFDQIVAGLSSGDPGQVSKGGNRPESWVASSSPQKSRWQRLKDRYNNARGGGGGGGGGGGRGGRGGGGWGGRSGRGPIDEMSSFRRVLLGAGIVQGAQGFAGMADTYTQLQMRLDGLTGSQEKSATTFARLREVARSTNTGLEDTTESYVRIRNATNEMNLSEEDSFKLMTNLNTMLATSGASTQEASSGMRQLTQAFASNKLAGDEFKSIAENMPNILKALQKATGKTEGQLRTMSEAGQINRKMLVDMLLNVKGLQKPVDTFGSTWQKFKDNMMVSFGEFSKNEKLVDDFKTVLKTIADVIIKDVVPAAAKLIHFLRENTFIIKGLVATGLASFVWTVGKAFLAFPIAAVVNAGKAIAFFRAMAAGGGAAGGVAGAAAGNAAKSGIMARLAAAVPGIGTAIGTAMIVNEATGGSVNDAGIGTMVETGSISEGFAAHRESRVSQGQSVWDKIDAYRGYKSGYGTNAALGGSNQIIGGGGSTINMNGVNITVNAQDGTDFANKYVSEMDKITRQAGATFNR